MTVENSRRTTQNTFRTLTSSSTNKYVSDSVSLSAAHSRFPALANISTTALTMRVFNSNLVCTVVDNDSYSLPKSTLLNCTVMLSSLCVILGNFPPFPLRQSCERYFDVFPVILRFPRNSITYRYSSPRPVTYVECGIGSKFCELSYIYSKCEDVGKNAESSKRKAQIQLHPAAFTSRPRQLIPVICAFIHNWLLFALCLSDLRYLCSYHDDT